MKLCDVAFIITATVNWSLSVLVQLVAVIIQQVCKNFRIFHWCGRSLRHCCEVLVQVRHDRVESLWLNFCGDQFEHRLYQFPLICDLVFGRERLSPLLDPELVHQHLFTQVLPLFGPLVAQRGHAGLQPDDLILGDGLKVTEADCLPPSLPTRMLQGDSLLALVRRINLESFYLFHEGLDHKLRI